MQQKKDNWVLGIEQEVANYPYKRFLGSLTLVISILILYFLKDISFLGVQNNIIIFLFSALIILSIILLVSPKNPNYLAFYIYQVGYEFPDFEVENSYLKRVQSHIKNCSKQVSYLRNDNFQQAKYFIDNILDFLDNLDHILLRLNHIYSKKNIDEALMAKLNETGPTLFMTKRDVISSKLIELAKLIHKNNSSLTQEHVNITNEILKELDGIPEKPFTKPLSEYFKEIRDKLPYKLRILIFLIAIFGIIFIVLSQILIYYGLGQQSYTTAMAVSGVLTAAAFSKIDLFITRERAR